MILLESSTSGKTLTSSMFSTLKKGIEKEGLRTLPSGLLATTPHFSQLGSPLTNPHVTTDFCEQQIELVTGTHGDCKGLFDELMSLQAFVARILKSEGDERIWCASMPGLLPDEREIQLAQYGKSNEGLFKTTYRSGLANRYGASMQTISGIHYNWSIEGLLSEDYFSLMRNFRRHAPLLLFLFGASPMVDESFIEGRRHNLKRLSSDTFYLPYATSLRLGRLGYQSDQQNDRHISFNGLYEFCDQLEPLLKEKYKPYESLGLYGDDGHYLQLNTNLLQIENEFYSSIRAKNTPRSKERVLHALRTRGVEYVEVRILDNNPFEACGIACKTITFLDIFLIHLLKLKSPLDHTDDILKSAQNVRLVSESGRDPDLKIWSGEKKVHFQTWIGEMLRDLAETAQQLDAIKGSSCYQEAVRSQQEILLNASTALPSSKVVNEVVNQHAGSWRSFAKNCSQKIHEELIGYPIPADRLAQLQQEALNSLVKREQREAQKKESFAAYLAHFFDEKNLR